MSYMGGVNYTPTQTVDEVADYTDMMGQASEMNQAQANKGAWKQSPTKSLVVLWVIAVLLYTVIGYYFRRHLA